MLPEFCSMCGAGFPPREGEGRCPDWHWCQQRTALIARVRADKQKPVALPESREEGEKG